MDPRAVQIFVGATAMTQAKTLGNYPAPQAILSAVFEGSVVNLDRALEIETRLFAHLFREGTARRMIRSLFIRKGEADNLVRRPTDIATSNLTRIGVLGAGMMGAAIAHVAAQAGLEVILIDRTEDAAQKGRAHTERELTKAQERNRINAGEAAAVLARITATTRYEALHDVQLVIEAVFEDRAIKAEVTRSAVAAMPPEAIFASNTSTLPISGLAEASDRPEQFIGLHFFSPVEKMQLVEVIRGQQTSPRALAVALDFVKLLRKTPIVVNDGRGFYTTKVVSTYILEGQAMLREGIPPALIDNAGRLAGMPVGPLSLADEVALDLSCRIRKQWKEDLGAQYETHPGEEVSDRMVEEHQRLGRKNGKGFYDYPADGSRKRLWSGLTMLYKPAPANQLPDVQELKQRLMYVQALEAARCLDNGVLTHAEDGDIGAIFGLGFAPFTGGPFSLIESVGVPTFVARCQALAGKHGPRFEPPSLLLRMAKGSKADAINWRNWCAPSYRA